MGATILSRSEMGDKYKTPEIETESEEAMIEEKSIQALRMKETQMLKLQGLEGSQSHQQN